MLTSAVILFRLHWWNWKREALTGLVLPGAFVVSVFFTVSYKTGEKRMVRDRRAVTDQGDVTSRPCNRDIGAAVVGQEPHTALWV